jgi:hypothetical protein
MRLVYQAFGLVIFASLITALALPSGCNKKKGTSGGGDVEQAREQSKSNLQQIAAAFHKFANKSGGWFPRGYLDLKTGNLGLSWRVQILPYLGDPEAAKLFEEFKLDQPWDSAHNKALLAKIPKVYAPVRGEAPEGHTFYQGFTRPGDSSLLLPDPKQQYRVPPAPDQNGGFRVPGTYGPATVPDGTASTFLVAEAGTPVPWTKPEDIEIKTKAERKGPIVTSVLAEWPNLGGLFDGNFHVAMASGDVYFAKKTPNFEKMLDFITPADGMIPDWSSVGLENPFGKTPSVEEQMQSKSKKMAWEPPPVYKSPPKDAGDIKKKVEILENKKDLRDIKTKER